MTTDELKKLDDVDLYAHAANRIAKLERMREAQSNVAKAFMDQEAATTETEREVERARKEIFKRLWRCGFKDE